MRESTTHQQTNNNFSRKTLYFGVDTHNFKIYFQWVLVFHVNIYLKAKKKNEEK